jgi:hypothetical protein
LGKSAESLDSKGVALHSLLKEYKKEQESAGPHILGICKDFRINELQDRGFCNSLTLKGYDFSSAETASETQQTTKVASEKGV